MHWNKSKNSLGPCTSIRSKIWEKNSRKPLENIEKPYILVYDIYYKQKIYPLAKKLADKLEAEIVTYSKSSSRIFYDYGPMEFIWLIKNSEFVISSSFHGSLFAMIFEKPFYAVNPEPYVPSSRLLDYLEMVGLKNLFLEVERVENLVIQPEIDWEKVKEIIELKRKESFDFLNNAFEV